MMQGWGQAVRPDGNPWPRDNSTIDRCSDVGGPSGFIRGQEHFLGEVQQQKQWGPERLTEHATRDGHIPGVPQAPTLLNLGSRHKVFHNCRALLAKYALDCPFQIPSYLGNTDMNDSSLPSRPGGGCTLGF